MGGSVVTAFILLKVERGHVKEVAEALADLAGVVEVYSVAGAFDLVATVRVKANEDLADLVTERMVALAGITHTETLIAFRTYSRKDVEAAFSLGAKG
jgi:DNA-binding Lrp family transcriptional regulator